MRWIPCSGRLNASGTPAGRRAGPAWFARATLATWIVLAAAAPRALLAAPPAGGIAEVLVQSQQLRLAQRPAPSAAEQAGEAAQRVQASFARLQLLAPEAADVRLVLVGGDLFAEAVFDQRALAASVAVGELPEGERLLMLAHELGHLRLGHWAALRDLYEQLIPGAVRADTTDPVAAQLGAAAHQQSHRHEFEADAWGFTLVRRLGFRADTAFGLLTRHGVQPDGATHPGTRRRLAQMRALDARLDHELTAPPVAATLALPATPVAAVPGAAGPVSP